MSFGPGSQIGSIFDPPVKTNQRDSGIQTLPVLLQGVVLVHPVLR